MWFRNKMVEIVKDCCSKKVTTTTVNPGCCCSVVACESMLFGCFFVVWSCWLSMLLFGC